MNIALFPSAFHPHLGGVEELSRQLGRRLQQLGHGVVILTNQWPRSLPSYETFEGMPLYRLPFRTNEAALKSRISYALTHRHVCRKTVEIMESHEVDLAHVQCVSSNAIYAMRARQIRALPLVVTLQGELTMDASRLFQRSTWARDTLRQALSEAEVVTGCSAKTIRDAEEYVGFRVPDAKVIFNAANLDDFQQSSPGASARPYIFALGRLAPQKGFDLLLESYDRANLAEYDLIIAGDGPERSALEALVQRLGLSERVRLVGRADRKEVAAYMLGCAFFVLPSRADEGLPVVCAEAMAAGKAVLAANSGGAPEAILHDQCGIVFEKGDRDALTSGLVRLAHDSRLRDRLGKAGSVRSALFSWSKVTGEYIEAYQEAIQRNRGRRNARSAA